MTSALAARRGLTVERLIDDELLRWLQDEAAAGESVAEQVSIDVDGAVDECRGMPDRRLRVLQGGAAVTTLLWSPVVLDRLGELTGRPWRPLGIVGHYSFYDPGSHLGVHRDADRCDVSVITIVSDSHRDPSLVAYPDRVRSSVAELRADPAAAGVAVSAAPGESIIIFGGIVPHAVPVLARGRTRVVAPLCYRPLD